MVGRGGRGEENRRQVPTPHVREIVAGFFDRQIGDEGAVNPGVGCRGTEAFQAEAQDWIQVGKDDQTGLGTLGANFTPKVQDIRKGRAVSQSAFTRPLNDGAVRNGIAKGNAKLDHVRTSINRAYGDFLARNEVWVATSQVGDEGRARFESNSQAELLIS